MALTNAIRRASRVAPFAFRTLAGTQRYLHYHPSTAIFAAVYHHSGNIFPRALTSLIHHYTTQGEKQVEVPEDFSFKIIDNVGDKLVKLTREYNGENIAVGVLHMPVLGGGDENEKEDQGVEQGDQSCVPMVVRISKNNGSGLEIVCTAYDDVIVIDRLNVKDPNCPQYQMPYEGPHFEDLDENLQKSFLKYLEVRGIKPSITNFLSEYLNNRDRREFARWLNNLKKFIEA